MEYSYVSLILNVLKIDFDRFFDDDKGDQNVITIALKEKQCTAQNLKSIHIYGFEEIEPKTPFRRFKIQKEQLEKNAFNEFLRRFIKSIILINISKKSGAARL